MAARKLLGLLNLVTNRPSVNASTQVSMFDPEKISVCLDHFQQNNEVIREIYETYAATLKYGESKLHITTDVLDRVAKEMDHFDAMLLKLCDHLDRDKELLHERKNNLRRIQEEVDESRKKLETHRMATDFRISEGKELAYQRALAMQRIIDFRKERLHLEVKTMQTRGEIDNIMDDFNEEQERCDNLMVMKDEYKTIQEKELELLALAWNKRREKTEVLQAITQGENIHQMLPQLLSGPGVEDWRVRQKNMRTIRSNRELIQEQIEDQDEQKELLQMRNQQLHLKISKQEELLAKLMEQKRAGFFNEDNFGKNRSYDDYENRSEEDPGGSLEPSGLSLDGQEALPSEVSSDGLVSKRNVSDISLD